MLSIDQALTFGAKKLKDYLAKQPEEKKDLTLKEVNEFLSEKDTGVMLLAKQDEQGQTHFRIKLSE